MCRDADLRAHKPNGMGARQRQRATLVSYHRPKEISSWWKVSTRCYSGVYMCLTSIQQTT